MASWKDCSMGRMKMLNIGIASPKSALKPRAHRQLHRRTITGWHVHLSRCNRSLFLNRLGIPRHAAWVNLSSSISFFLYPSLSLSLCPSLSPFIFVFFSQFRPLPFLFPCVPLFTYLPPSSWSISSLSLYSLFFGISMFFTSHSPLFAFRRSTRCACLPDSLLNFFFSVFLSCLLRSIIEEELDMINKLITKFSFTWYFHFTTNFESTQFSYSSIYWTGNRKKKHSITI